MVERRITLVETELTDAPIVTPDLAKISEALAAMPCSPYKGTYIGASEWADIVNAAWFACGGSEEGYKLADEWCRGWFFYKVEDLRKRWDNCAKFPPQGFDANTLFKLAARETTDYILREIITNHRITHWVVVAAAPGEVPVTRRVDKEGPVMFATTTTKAELHPEMETRFLSMEIDDTQKQTRRVLVKIAQTRGGGFGGAAPDIASWHAYQRLLAMGERRVVLPFAETLAKHPGLDDKPVRMRRDFLQVIDAIKAHALLHRTHRKRDDQGRIVANIEDDYDVVRWLLNNRLAQGLGSQLKPTLLRVFDAVEACIDKDKGVTVQTIVEKLKLEQTTANRRLLKLASYGLLENLTPGRGRAAHYVVSGQPAEREALPSTDDLLEAWNKETHTHTEPTP